jgi:hypothetical protein
LIGYILFKAKPKVYFSILGIIFIIAFFKEYEFIKCIKYIGIGLLIVVLLLLLLIVYLFIDNHINPQKEIPKRKGLKRYDYYITSSGIPENKWTEHNFLRLGIDIVDAPYIYVHTALLINNDTKVCKLNDKWVEQETEQETEYSKFIGMAVEIDLKSRMTYKNNLNLIDGILFKKNTWN